VGDGGGSTGSYGVIDVDEGGRECRYQVREARRESLVAWMVLVHGGRRGCRRRPHRSRPALNSKSKPVSDKSYYPKILLQATYHIGELQYCW
jgi:hypothetical protein